MEQAKYIKAIFTAVFAFISALLGDLAIPVIIMVASSVIDYATGLGASPYRKQDINSYKSIRGIVKKVCMWLLVYSADKLGITVTVPFLIACIVAVWIICNELISILENIKDMGVNLPPFLMPLLKNIKSQVEDKADNAVGNEGTKEDK